MPRGRKPKPAELRVIEGTQSSASMRKKTPAPKAAPMGKPPAGMSAEALAHWTRLKVEWRTVLMPSDGQALALFCNALAELDEASAKVEAEGLYADTNTNGQVIAPWGRVVENRREFCRKMLSDFFGTPAARSRFAGAEGDDGSVDKKLSAYGL